MAVYNDMLSDLPRVECAQATEFVAAHSEHDGIGKVTGDPELACPWDMNSGDLIRRLISFVCTCGGRLDLEIIS